MTKIETNWLVGFTDGEGCYHIGIAKNETYSLKYQVLPEFVITQHQRDIKLLYAIKSFFGCGVVRTDKKGICHYRVRNFKHLSEIIVPFFEKHSLKTMKKVDFLKFRKVILLMRNQEHLTSDGLDKIRKIKNNYFKIESNLD